MSVCATSVLIVEDNPGDVRLIEEMLRETGGPDLRTLNADALAQGLPMLREETVDVVLLDLGLPDSQGLDTLAQTVAAAPLLPIIVLTGRDDEKLAMDSLRNGAQDYLTKGRIDGPVLDRAIRYAIERKRNEEALHAAAEHQRLLLSELDHRVRNNLASLLGLIEISHERYDNVDAFAVSMRQRVQMIATVHTLLSRSNWLPLPLENLIAALLPPGAIDQVEIAGPALQVPVRQMPALGMVLHEFITNSTKYGSLSVRDGELRIQWESVPLEDDVVRITLEWCERGGPKIDQPHHSGVGMSLIDGLVNSELQGEVTMSFPPGGAHHRLVITLDAREVEVNSQRAAILKRYGFSTGRSQTDLHDS
ncbi:MAG: response regulator [Phycisphaerales bacterium]|nr:MAG: response regulator [Phycisphaerales bacterium]